MCLPELGQHTPFGTGWGLWPSGPLPNASGPTSGERWNSWPTFPSTEQVLMIKSWNEWAEGNYLEPDRQYGHARLEMLASEVARAKGHRWR